MVYFIPCLPGKNEICLICIIENTIEEFNTMITHCSKLLANNYKKIGSSKGKCDRRTNRSSADATRIKLLAYKSVHMTKDTALMLNFDTTADFDRIYRAYGNMLDAKKQTTQYLCKGISLTTEMATRNT